MEAAKISVPCGTCSSKIGIDYEFCSGCGRAVTDVDRTLLRSRLEKSSYAATRASLGSSDYEAHARTANVGSAAKWIGLIASLYVLGGAVSFAGQQAEGHERYMNLGLHLGIAALMGGLWWWAKRAPLPAIACAMGLFLVVQVSSALLDPTTIAQGLIVKILAMVALGKGPSAALAARASTHQPNP